MTDQKTPGSPQERLEGVSSTPAPPEELNGPQSGAQPRGPVDWARQQAAEREAAASDPAWNTLRARAFNAVQPALRQAGEWLPLSARRAVADAVLAELKPEIDFWAEAAARAAKERDTACAALNRLSNLADRIDDECAAEEAEDGLTPYQGGRLDTARHIHAALDPPAHDTGPSVAEAAANDRRWWNGEKAGE